MIINFSQIHRAANARSYRVVQGETCDVHDGVSWRYEQFMPEQGHEFKDGELVLFGSRGEFPICLRLIVEQSEVVEEDKKDDVKEQESETKDVGDATNIVGDASNIVGENVNEETEKEKA